MSIKIGGLQLEGCTFDGTRLAENQRDSATVSSVPNCVVAWISKVHPHVITSAHAVFCSTLSLS